MKWKVAFLGKKPTLTLKIEGDNVEISALSDEYKVLESGDFVKKRVRLETEKTIADGEVDIKNGEEGFLECLLDSLERRGFVMIDAKAKKG